MKVEQAIVALSRRRCAEISVDSWVVRQELFDRIPIPYVLLDVPIGNDGMIQASSAVTRIRHMKMMIHNKTELEKRFSDLLNAGLYLAAAFI